VIGAAIQKDIWLLLRDRGALISLFALPIVFMTAFGAMFDFDRNEPRPIAIWHPPAESRGLAVAYALTGAPGFAPAPQASADAVRAAVAAKRAEAGLIVTADTVELVIDRGLPMQVRAPLEGALENLIVRALVPPGVALPHVTITSPPGVARPAENITSFQVAVPGNAVLFGFFLALTVAMSFANERRIGTWHRLLAAPVPRWQALAGMLVPYFFVGCGQLAFFFAVGVLAFGMTVAGSVAALIALSFALVYCAVTLGLLFAAIGGSERQLGGFGSVVLLVMGMVGGCMVPRLVMPPAMQKFGLAVPHGWALDGYYDVLVREGTSIADVAPSLTALLLFGTAFATIGLALFRFERV
jgi:ABC-type multidrug transport system permease subunit